MAHQSEDARRLTIRTTRTSLYSELPKPNPDKPEVWFLVLPFGRTTDHAKSDDWFERIQRFSESLNAESVFCLLTSAEDAAETLPKLMGSMRFQLWVAVKLANLIDRGQRYLPNHHASLLVLSKYHASLKHTKTRIAYTYCPVCDKTTKDYGGKKHTYHEYGTLMSDVWRDFAWEPSKEPMEVAERLADVFGLAPFHELKVLLFKDHVPSALPDSQLAQTILTPKHSAPENSRLINGDCLAELAKIPGDSIDFCFADPPYNLDKHYDNWDDALDSVKYFNWCDAWLSELARVLKPGRTCAVLNIPQFAVRHYSFLKQKLRFQNWLVWEGLSLPVRMIMPSHYSIVCFTKGPPRDLPGRAGMTGGSATEYEARTALEESYCVRASCIARRKLVGVRDRAQPTDLWWDIHRLKHNSRRVDHPCQLPPALMRRLISLFTLPGETILDPFNGAGTTSLCAEAIGRHFIGIELSEKYHALARKRHELLHMGGDPFAKSNGGPPKAKNSRVKRIGDIEYVVSKKNLQLEVRAIAKSLGHLPSREEVMRLSKHPAEYFDNYFVSWGEVCAAARTTGMTEDRVKITNHKRNVQRTLF